MNPITVNLRDIKKMSLERHWLYNQLVEMSGLNIRTIHRIENGGNAGLEPLKSLAAVFEINIADSDKREEMGQIRKEEEYVQNVKGFYKLFAVAILGLVVPFILAVNDSSNCPLFLWILISWGVILGIYSPNVLTSLEKNGEKK
jgi:transcriptional regulator with XRE-family HTH domain